MASPPPPPRSTRSRPSLPPSGIPSTSSSASSHPDRGSSPKSANAIAHAMYTESLSGLGKKDRAGRATSRKKSSGELGAERMMDEDTEEAASTPKSKPSDADSIADQSVKDEDLEAAGLFEGAEGAAEGGKVEGSARERPPPPALVVTTESPQDIEMDQPEPEVAGSRHEDDEDDEDDESDEDGADVTRCVCGITESDDMMIQCDTCNVWQHGACVGIPTEEETPDEYFCEKCRPDLHVALSKWMRSMSRGRGGIFLPPSASDLQRLNADDSLPPNQSKRWTHDLPNLPPIIGGHESDSESDRGGRGRRSRSSRTKPASTTSNGPAPAAVPGSSTSSLPSSSSHRPLPFPPRKTAAPNGAAGPSSTASSSSHPHPPPTPTSSSSRPPVSKSHKRQVSSSSNHHGLTQRQLSPIAPSSSQSPPPAKLKSPKKRSTMNSRDAGLEEAIRESLLAAGGVPEDEKTGSSRRSASSNGSIRDKDEHLERRSTAGSKRGRKMSIDSSAAGGEAGPSTAAPAPSKKSKKAKKETITIDPSIPTSPSLSHPHPSPSLANGNPYDEHHPSHPHHGGKAKHPNQYTYRPKTSPSSAAFPPSASLYHAPAASTSASKEGPSPSKPSKEKVSHVSLSSAAHDHGTRRNHSGPSSSNGKGSSGGTHSHGQREGTGTSTPTWGIPDHLSHLAHLLPSTAPRPLLVGVNLPPNLDLNPASTSASASNFLPQPKPFTTGPREEPPTRVKWPAKRMTIGEMRKRVRGVLDFVGRWPVGDDREGPVPRLFEGEEPSEEPVRGKTRAEEVEELVRDLISFEARFGVAIPSSGLRSGDLGANLRSGTPTSVVVEEEGDLNEEGGEEVEVVPAVEALVPPVVV